jgi:activator of HSP90 ATPase
MVISANSPTFVFLTEQPIMQSLKKYYIIPATPAEVYQAITNPISIQLWTGEEAQMSTEPGSEFSLWEGSIVGRNIEFIEDKKIVQQWYFGDQVEESIVTIILHPDKHGTSAELRHTNIPDGDFKDITEGWDTAYFGSIIDFFDGL